MKQQMCIPPSSIWTLLLQKCRRHFMPQKYLTSPSSGRLCFSFPLLLQVSHFATWEKNQLGEELVIKLSFYKLYSRVKGKRTFICSRQTVQSVSITLHLHGWGAFCILSSRLQSRTRCPCLHPVSSPDSWISTGSNCTSDSVYPTSLLALDKKVSCRLREEKDEAPVNFPIMWNGP